MFVRNFGGMVGFPRQVGRQVFFIITSSTVLRLPRKYGYKQPSHTHRNNQSSSSHQYFQQNQWPKLCSDNTGGRKVEDAFLYTTLSYYRPSGDLQITYTPPYHESSRLAPFFLHASMQRISHCSRCVQYCSACISVRLSYRALSVKYTLLTLSFILAWLFLPLRLTKVYELVCILSRTISNLLIVSQAVGLAGLVS